MARPFATVRARLGEQGGFGLVEVLVSALVVVVISLAVLGSLDAASRASGTSKLKATAAALAQQDQDRMQGMKPQQLMSYVRDRTETVDVDGAGAGRPIDYTVRSEGQYVLNPASGGGCTHGQRDEYLRIVTTVSWPEPRSRPVRIESLIAPPLDAAAAGQGSAVLKLTRADGVTPVAGQLVSLVGPQSGQQATGDEGCAYFANHQIGAYRFEFSSPGWVDPSGNSAVSLPVGVTSQAVASLDGLYDRGGRVERATFVTVLGSNILYTRGDRLTLAHSGVPTNGGARSAAAGQDPANPSAWQASIDGLFPFTSPYAAYSSGQCGKPLPANVAADVNANPAGLASLKVDPGQTYASRYVLEPAMNPTVRYGTGTSPWPVLSGARVYFRSADPACPTREEQTTGTNGTIADVGFPYGDWTWCAEYKYGAGANQWRRTSGGTNGWGTRTNDTTTGESWDMTISSTSGDARC